MKQRLAEASGDDVAIVANFRRVGVNPDLQALQQLDRPHRKVCA
jgi:hypothetical protein